MFRNFDVYGGIYRQSEDWRSLPITWQRGGGGAHSSDGVIVPPKPPTLQGLYGFFYMLDTVADLIRLGYRFINGVFVRLGVTKDSWQLKTVELWFWMHGELRHVCGYGNTYREAHAAANRMIRRVDALLQQEEAAREAHHERATT